MLRRWMRSRSALASGIGASLTVAGVIAGALATGAAGAHRAESVVPPPALPAAVVEQGRDGLAAGALQDPSRTAEFASRTDATATRLRIPSIGVDTSLETLGIGAEGELLAPVDFSRAGWFSEGVVPGDVGPAAIAGHIDSPSGPAVFLRVGELLPGDLVLVDLSSGETITFAVTRTAQSAKATFPTSDVYGPVPRPELRLITCTGSFDRASGHYLDNLVVYAAVV